LVSIGDAEMLRSLYGGNKKTSPSGGRV
jgi:hypothetical protein